MNKTGPSKRKPYEQINPSSMENDSVRLWNVTICQQSTVELLLSSFLYREFE